MVLLAELVCEKCKQVLTYPLGSISCRCRNCRTVNPAQHLEVECGKCRTSLVFPINTLEGVCPCCTTVIEIPIDTLPLVDEISLGGPGENGGPAKTVYVENPPTVIDGKTYPSVCIATKIA